jgi:phage portal protein BeeE
MTKEKAFNKIARISGNAAKSFFGLDMGLGGTIQSDVINPINYRSGGIAFGNEGWNFGGAGSFDVFFSYGGLKDIVKAYECCAPIYSIVNKQAYAYVNGKIRFADAKDKDVTNPYTKKIQKLLLRPNPMQNGKQFDAQTAIYLRLFGYAVWLPVKPVGFKNEDATAMWNIPPYMCEITTSKKTFFSDKGNYIESIVVRYGNEITTLSQDDVIIIKDITPGFNHLFLPNSPIKSIQQNISNVIGIYNSKGALIHYRGALGILTPEKDPAGVIPLDEDEKEEIQTDLLRYGLKSNQWKFIVSNSALKWQQMGMPYRDLMLTEWAEDDTMVIADALNYPYRLLAAANTTSISGTEAEAFKKQLYQDFVIPFSNMVYEQISEFFGAADYGVSIKKDFSHIPVLQEDKINSGRARLYLNQGLLIEWQNNIITANQWLAINQMDPIPDGDMYYYQWVALGKKFNSPAQITVADNSSSSGNNNN